MTHFININGRLLPAGEAGIAADNRAFRYGYGLFETMLLHNGAIRLAEYHWQRLFEGITHLRMHMPAFFREELERETMRTVRKNRLEALCRIRLQVYAGNGGLYDGDDFTARYVIEAYPLAPEVLSLNETGLVAGISDIIKPTGPYAHLKASAALPYALAAREAKAQKWNDALLLNEHGNIADSTIANVFWVMDTAIFTPPLSEGCVAGVMRRHLLRALPDLGYNVAEKVFHPQMTGTADAVFLTNAIRGIQWVGELAGTLLFLVGYTGTPCPHISAFVKVITTDQYIVCLAQFFLWKRHSSNDNYYEENHHSCSRYCNIYNPCKRSNQLCPGNWPESG